MKTFLVAVVSVVAFSMSSAFAQCGGGSCGSKKGDKKEDVKESATHVIHI